MEKALRALLRDFDYELAGSVIIQKGIRGFSSDRIFGRARGLLDACEQLIPLIHDDAYHSRLIKITEPDAPEYSAARAAGHVRHCSAALE